MGGRSPPISEKEEASRAVLPPTRALLESNGLVRPPLRERSLESNRLAVFSLARRAMEIFAQLGAPRVEVLRNSVRTELVEGLFEATRPGASWKQARGCRLSNDCSREGSKRQ